jgi:DNA-binding beta-propeller fold protein YncE
MKSVGCLAFALIAMFVRGALAFTNVPEAPHAGEGGVPMFERDMSWPKLPEAWNHGAAVSWAAADEQDHIWLITRPRTLLDVDPNTPKSAVPPPVLEFDQDGKYLRGWGGQSGPGYVWPYNEHGLTVDSKGFIWILGNNDSSNGRSKFPSDSQVLKFSKDGKFIMAFGKPGEIGSNSNDILRGAANSYYYAKTNELLVADGYGNSRIVVYDADTGKVKRTWGAYGNKPLDAGQRVSHIDHGSGGRNNPFRELADKLQQFDTVHDVKMSDDGLVYVADRNNKRIQVFTIDGRFVTEKFLGLDSEFPLQARSVGFSPDQRFLYVGGTPVIYILNRKTLEVLGTVYTGVGTPGHPPGHGVSVDHHGNLYLVQADTSGLDGKSKNTFGAYRWKFIGYSPATPCCQAGRRMK